MLAMSAEPQPPDPTPPRPSSWLWFVAIALGAIWMGYLAFFGPRGRLGRSHAPELGPGGTRNHGHADFTWTLRDLHGKPLEFAQFRGRPIFVNIWATWCPPCVAEMPAIDRLAANPRLKDVAFLCVSVEDDAATVARFARDKALKVPVYLGGSEAPASFRTDAIPATFIIDRQGTIVVREIGSAKWDEESVIARLEQLATPPD
jgi:thiol-disulfide isomerase/thioredoxin